MSEYVSSRPVSGYSLLSALIFFSAAIAAVSLLRRRSESLRPHGVSLLLLAAALALIRLLLPLDLPFAYVLSSWTVIPAIKDFFRGSLWLPEVLLATWSAGAAAVLARDVRDLIRARQICGRYRIVPSPAAAEARERLGVKCPVLVSPDVPVPYVAGLFRHRIYLPDQNLSPREIELILLHETQHVRSRDSLIKLFWGLLSAILWWNPPAYQFRRELDTLLEFRCDMKVTSPMDKAEQTEYLEMLLQMAKDAENCPKQTALSMNESAALSKPSVMKQRFKLILGSHQKAPRYARAGITCVLIALFLASYLVIWQPAYEPPEEEGVMTLNARRGQENISLEEIAEIDHELEKAHIEKIEGKFYLYINWQRDRELSPAEVQSDEYKNLMILEDDCFS